VVRIDRDTGAVAVGALSRRLRYRQSGQPDAGRGAARRRRGAGTRRRTFGEFLYDARGEPLCVSFDNYLMPTAARGAAGRCAHHRGRAEPHKPARAQGRRRRWRQMRSARCCRGYR